MPDAGMRDGLIDMFSLRMRNLANDLTSGAIDLGTWQTQMKDELRNLYGLQMLAAVNGDRSLITAEMRMNLGLAMQAQYDYLATFAGDIALGRLSAAQIAARAAQYAWSVKATYWRVANRNYDVPAQPGEGTVCKCGCSWRFVDNADGSVDAYWERSLDDSCEICIQREQDWNPYRIPATEAA